MIASFALAVIVGATPPRDAWFGADKLKHFLVAAFTQSVSYGVLQAARVRHDHAIVGASAATAAVSLGKELYDRRTDGLFSVRDLVWDAAGAAAATVLLHGAVRTGSSDRSAAARAGQGSRSPEGSLGRAPAGSLSGRLVPVRHPPPPILATGPTTFP